MDNYYKGKNVEEELDRAKIPIPDLPNDYLWMQVKGGSKMSNLLAHASSILQGNSETSVVWSGSGVAISKAISCAEILKRQFSMEHQVTRLTCKKVEEYWEPKIDGLETIVVKRQIPVIHILLSKDLTLDGNPLGYQRLSGNTFWEKKQISSSSKVHQPKRPFKHRKPTVKIEKSQS